MYSKLGFGSFKKINFEYTTQRKIFFSLCAINLAPSAIPLQDIESIDALAEAIGEYDGGVIIVS